MAVQTATTKSRRATWGPWSPAQIVAVVLGGFFVILGTVALARVGMSSLTSPTETVWGLAHTPLMALIEIALGLFILASAPGSAPSLAATGSGMSRLGTAPSRLIPDGTRGLTRRAPTPSRHVPPCVGSVHSWRCSGS